MTKEEVSSPELSVQKPGQTVSQDMIKPELFFKQEMIDQEPYVKYEILTCEEAKKCKMELFPADLKGEVFCDIGDRNLVKKESMDQAMNLVECTVNEYIADTNMMLATNSTNRAQLNLVPERAGKIFCCNICDFSSKWKNSLKDHALFAHSKAMPFSCSQCDFRCKK